MRCKGCNRMQSNLEQKLYDDFCKKCAEVSQRPDDEHADQGLDTVYLDQGWTKDE